MDYIKKIILTFVLSLAGITISTAIFITVFYNDWKFSILLIWEVIIMSAVCSLGNLIFYSKKEISKKRMRYRMIIHYLYINLIVFGGAFLWGWIDPGYLLQLAVMLILIAVVYAGVMYANLIKEEKTAEDLNDRLSRLNTGEEENNK